MVRRPAWLFPSRFGLIAAAIALLLATPASALDKVSLQLKWKHQFQFAGYYMALEKGFYRDAGLDVEIREGGPGIDAVKDLGDGKADFGVCTTSVLLAKPSDPKLVVLGVVFQHSAAVILTPSRSRITSPSELKSRWLMDAPGSDDLVAMLKHEGVDYATLPRVIHEGNPMDLVTGKADAMVAYATNEPFFLEQQGIPYRVFAPRTFGFDFYGDAFCTLRRTGEAAPRAHARLPHRDPARLGLRAGAQGGDGRPHRAAIPRHQEPRRVAVRGVPHRGPGSAEAGPPRQPDHRALAEDRQHLSRPRHAGRSPTSRIG